ncbi:hypothetical protein SCHPADRAFT_676484 [Schizopora paradoxa]|uniref:Uncharacterized protein n=1 Tax=Schizopora paradoxa TaxID=27342 RepID=A0A0H2RBF0_9AGAM|nr:hypothetical protein SCHPADRAFT_676484 [Schizopora paradoxa]
MMIIGRDTDLSTTIDLSTAVTLTLAPLAPIDTSDEFPTSSPRHFSSISSMSLPVTTTITQTTMFTLSSTSTCNTSMIHSPSPACTIQQEITRSSSTGEMAAIGISSSVATALIVLLVSFFHRRRSLRKHGQGLEKSHDQHSIDLPSYGEEQREFARGSDYFPHSGGPPTIRNSSAHSKTQSTF